MEDPGIATDSIQGSMLSPQVFYCGNHQQGKITEAHNLPRIDPFTVTLRQCKSYRNEFRIAETDL
eukprot:316723-Amphidinium_carterae.1